VGFTTGSRGEVPGKRKPVTREHSNNNNNNNDNNNNMFTIAKQAASKFFMPHFDGILYITGNLVTCEVRSIVTRVARNAYSGFTINDFLSGDVS
jgi:hypothetical protein